MAKKKVRKSRTKKVYDDQSKLVRAPEPIKIGNLELALRPLIDINYASLDSYVRSKHILTAVNAAKEIEDIDPESAALIRQEAISQASSLSFLTPKGRAIIQDVDGIARITWEMAGGSDCKYSIDQIKEAILSDPDTVNDVNDIFDVQNHEDPEEGENDTGKKQRNL